MKGEDCAPLQWALSVLPDQLRAGDWCSPSTPLADLFVGLQQQRDAQVRRLLDVIRGKSYEDALVLMEYMPYRACEPILKVLMSVRVSRGRCLAFCARAPPLHCRLAYFGASV